MSHTHKNSVVLALVLCVLAILAMTIMQSIMTSSALTGQSLYGPWNASDYMAEKFNEASRKLTSCLNEKTLLRSQLEARSKAAAGKK